MSLNNPADAWEPTCILRRFGVGDVLEQRWRKPLINSMGYLSGWDYQWRSVPHVYGGDIDSSLTKDSKDAG